MSRSLVTRRGSRVSRTCAKQSKLGEAYAEAVRRGPCVFQGPERRLMWLESRIPFAETKNARRGPGLVFGDVE